MRVAESGGFFSRLRFFSVSERGFFDRTGIRVCVRVCVFFLLDPTATMLNVVDDDLIVPTNSVGRIR